MSDHLARSLERSALSGSPADQARALVSRLRVAPWCEMCEGRGWQLLASNLPGAPSHACVACAGTGSPLRARVDLAAYCGDEGARLAMGPDAAVNRIHDGWGRLPVPLDGWLAVLSRWSDIGPAPGWVLVRAAVAAARVALEKWAGCPAGDGSWRAAPHGACVCGYGYDAHVNQDKNPRRASAVRVIHAAAAWLACPCDDHREAWSRAWAAATNWLSEPSWLPEPGEFVTAHVAPAARLSGESPVRAAICSSLVEWALGG